MNQPTVTIIICNNNYSEYLSDAINSARRQSYPNLRMCVIDDGSIDGSWKLIHEELFKHTAHEKHTQGDLEFKKGAVSNTYSSNLPDIGVVAIKKPTCDGPSIARNIGMMHVWNNTDVFAILDADDMYTEHKVSKCVMRMMEAFNMISVVYTDYEIIDVHTGNRTIEFKEPYSRDRLMQECIVHSNSLINKTHLLQILENNNVYDPNLRTVEDWDLWLRLSDISMMVHIAEPLSIVRTGNYNSTNTVSKEDWERNWAYVANKTRQRLQR